MYNNGREIATFARRQTIALWSSQFNCNNQKRAFQMLLHVYLSVDIKMTDQTCHMIKSNGQHKYNMLQQYTFVESHVQKYVQLQPNHKGRSIDFNMWRTVRGVAL
jgi:hypothetical protein